MGLRSLIRKTVLYKKYKAKIESKMSDEEWFVKRHKNIFGYTPDFKNPKTFNEKIIHRILFDRDPIYTALADKLKARIYIAYMLKDFEQDTEGKTRNSTSTSQSNMENNAFATQLAVNTHGGGKLIVI